MTSQAEPETPAATDGPARDPAPPASPAATAPAAPVDAAASAARVPLATPEPAAASPSAAPPGPVPMRTDDLSAFFGAHKAIEDVTLEFPHQTVTALIGPSGCGKSTYIRCLNRMHEMVPNARTEGSVYLRDIDIYGREADPVAVRRAVGMVFQRPNPFPTKSIADNILAGPKFLRMKVSRGERDDLVERTLRGAGLWDEVKNRLHAHAGALSGGQQQRLCIARSLAVNPDVLLMDEPCSALDPQSTLRIEDLIRELSHNVTIVIVTHNMQQAARVSDYAAFITIENEGEPGRLIETGPTREIFGSPRHERTEAYVSGRFG
jgi:phosphate transport system ATP-binding protein